MKLGHYEINNTVLIWVAILAACAVGGAIISPWLWIAAGLIVLAAVGLLIWAFYAEWKQ